MEVQVEVAHAKKDRRAGLIATIVIHAVIIALLIWAVLPKSDPPIEELGGTGMEIGLGGIEGEGAMGAMGGGSPQDASEAASTPASAESTPQDEDILSNDAEDPDKVVKQSTPVTTKTKTKTKQVTTNTSTKETPKDPAIKNKLQGIWGDNGSNGADGNATDGDGKGKGLKGNGLGSKGNGKDANSGGGGVATLVSNSRTLLNKQHNCVIKSISIQKVKLTVDRSGRVIKAEGNQPGTKGPKDACVVQRAEEIAKNDYRYDANDKADKYRYVIETITLDVTK